MVSNGAAVEAVLIASEKLNDDAGEWIPVPKNHFIAVDRDLQGGPEPDAALTAATVAFTHLSIIRGCSHATGFRQP